MFLKMLRIIGAFLLVTGIGLLAYIVLGSPIHVAAPTQNYGEPICSGDSKCQITASLCSDVTNEVSFSRPKISESDSLVLMVNLINNENRTCTGGVILNAPNFDVSPAQTTRTFELSPGSNTHRVTWILTPKKAGRFPVTVSSGGYREYNTVSEISVTDILGFTPRQAKLLSYLGTFGGAMFTAPWWYEQLIKFRNQGKKAPPRSQNKDEEEIRPGSARKRTKTKSPPEMDSDS